MRSLEKSVTTFVEEAHSAWIQSSFEVSLVLECYCCLYWKLIDCKFIQDIRGDIRYQTVSF